MRRIIWSVLLLGGTVLAAEETVRYELLPITPTSLVFSCKGDSVPTAHVGKVKNAAPGAPTVVFLSCSEAK